jgi:hypothetical protein
MENRLTKVDFTVNAQAARQLVTRYFFDFSDFAANFSDEFFVLSFLLQSRTFEGAARLLFDLAFDFMRFAGGALFGALFNHNIPFLYLAKYNAFRAAKKWGNP